MANWYKLVQAQLDREVKALVRLLSTAGSLCIVLFLLSIFVAHYDVPAEMQPRRRSARNLMQIGATCLQYANDHGGEYPDSFGTLLMNEDITSVEFYCPGSGDTPAEGATKQEVAQNMIAGGHLSYVYLGRGLTRAMIGGSTIIAYERPSIFPDGANVLWGDGHADFQNPKVIEGIVTKSAAGVFPISVP